MASGGWVKLHRQATEHWIYSDKPYDRRSAWNDLIMSANHRDGKFNIGNQIIPVKRGSFVTSEIKLGERWGWTRKSVRNFLKLLENDGMLTKKSTTKYTSITIDNYNLYQGEGTTEDTTTEQQRNNNGTTTEQQSIHKQEVKEVKEYKECKECKEDPSTQNLSPEKNPAGEIIHAYQKYLNDHNIERQQRVLTYLDAGLDVDVIIECIRESIIGEYPAKYVFGILDKCVSEKVNTLPQYIDRKKQHNRKQEEFRKEVQQKKAELTNRMTNRTNFDQREYDEEEIERFYITASNKYQET